MEINKFFPRGHLSGDPSKLIINKYRPSATRTEYADVSNILNQNLGRNSQDNWRTSGSADGGDNDRFKISFGLTKKQLFSVEIGASNKNLQIDYPRNSGAFVDA